MTNNNVNSIRLSEIKTSERVKAAGQFEKIKQNGSRRCLQRYVSMRKIMFTSHRP